MVTSNKNNASEAGCFNKMVAYTDKEEYRIPGPEDWSRQIGSGMLISIHKAPFPDHIGNIRADGGVGLQMEVTCEYIE